MDSFYITPDNYNTAQQNGITAHLLTNRVRTYGWDIIKATTTTPRPLNTNQEWRDIAKENNISSSIFSHRVSTGMSMEKASSMPVMDKATLINNMAIAKRKYPKEYEDLAVSNGISVKTFCKRMSRRWGLVEAATRPMKGS